MLKKIMLATATVFSLMSLQAMAATEITREETSKYVHMGDISVSGNFVSSTDAVAAIKAKAEEAGADYFFISRFTRGNRGFGTNAVLYKQN